jgi:Integrase zinc binding domain
VLKAPKEHTCFGVHDGLIWTKNLYKRDVICIPHSVFLKGRRLIEVIINHAHQVVGHFGQLKTLNYIRRVYWWPGMATDVDSFCTSCVKCQTSKDSTKKPIGLLHSLPVPEWPWQSIGMDFMGPLPKSDTHDYLLVVIDRLMLQVHLIPMDMRVTVKGVAWLFLREVVHLHGVPDSIVSDRDTKFTSIFWRELQRIMGVKLLMSTAFHPQMDGATERVNRSIGQILHTVVQSDQQDWAQKCPMVEFTLNSNVSSTTGFTPFELNSGYMPRIGIPLANDTKFTGVRQFVQQARTNLLAAHDVIVENRVSQTFHVNKKCQASPGYWRGDKVYLSMKNLTLCYIPVTPHQTPDLRTSGHMLFLLIGYNK